VTYIYLLAAVASPESTYSFQFQQISQSHNESSVLCSTGELGVNHMSDVQSVSSVEGENEVECRTDLINLIHVVFV